MVLRRLWSRTKEVATLYTGTFVLVMLLNQLVFFGFCLNPVCLIAAMPHVLFITVIVGSWWNNRNGWGKKSAGIVGKTLRAVEKAGRAIENLDEKALLLEKKAEEFNRTARLARQAKLKELRAELSGLESKDDVNVSYPDPIAKLPLGASTAFNSKGVYSLWHLTHRDNVASILQRGIRSHADVYDHLSLPHVVDISDASVQRWRDREDPVFKRKINQYVPLYISPRNPMLFRMRSCQKELCFVEVGLSALDSAEFLICDGNAAARKTNFYATLDGLENLPWDVLGSDYWAGFADGKRKKCSEVLIYPMVAVASIERIHCFSDDTCRFLLASTGGHDVGFSVSENLYFEAN